VAQQMTANVRDAGDAPLAVRCATATDAPALAALVNSAYRGDSSRAGWTTEADLLGGQRVDVEGLQALIARGAVDGGAVVLVHEDAAGIAACVELEPRGRGCYLGMLTVRPMAQAGGLGRRLLAAAERYAVGHFGTREMRMNVISQRTELLAWYERRGYQRTGERLPFPYDDPRFGLPNRPDLEFVVLTKALL
jgi:ribosomal protein S18 acetylase RimI-like enzyme